MNPDQLFVYGTLRPGQASPAMQPLVDRLTVLGDATIQGTLHRLAQYPALTLDGNTTVHGLLLRLPADAQLLAALDDYEGYAPAAPPQENLFRRETVEVTDDRGTSTPAWVYVYNQPLPTR